MATDEPTLHRRAWTEYEIMYLVLNHAWCSYEEIAYALHRKPEAVTRKAQRLGLKKIH